MPLRLAIFDFDQTLSTVHLYNALSGDESSWRLPSPHARTEAGQLARLAELEATPEFRQQGGIAMAAFGGSERVAQLHGVLRQLVGAGVECIICSRGLVGPVRKCLDQLGLLNFFSKVYANVGSAYGSTPYDRQLPPGILGADSRYMGSPDLADWNNNKQVLVSRCLRERGLRGSDAVFVDDHPSEIESVRSVCPTVQVQSQRGIGQREIELLRSLLTGSPTAAGGIGAMQLPTAAPADRGQSHGHSAAQSPSPRERSSFSGTETPAQVGSACSQGSALHRQASRAGPTPPPSAATMPPLPCGGPQHASMMVTSSGWLPAEHTQVPTTCTMPPLQQSQQPPPSQQQLPRQAAASFLLAVPQQPLPHRQAAPMGSPELGRGHKFATPQQAQPYLTNQSFVQPMATLEDLGRFRQKNRHSHQQPTLEEHDASFTESDAGCPAGVASRSQLHGEKRKRDRWCLCQ